MLELGQCARLDPDGPQRPGEDDHPRAAPAVGDLHRDPSTIGQADGDDGLGGTTREVTALVRETPGLVAKDGAESVVAVGLADGRGVAVKVADGGGRARPAAAPPSCLLPPVPPADSMYRAP